MKAIRIHEFGGPEVLRYEDIPEPAPKPNEAVVKIDAAGVNFIDIYQRSGIYKLTLPATLGLEGGGVVSAIGSDVTEVKVGDRVAWTSVPGAYAGFAAVPADRLVVLPAGVTTRQGAAAMLQGLTAHYLSHSTFPLRAADTCLVHAGAGGVGLLLTQMAKRLGARVITTVSTEEKAALSREAGADLVVLYTKQDFEAEVKAFTGGKGVPVVYDSVGQTTFEKSINCLAPRGMLVLFGQSSGVVPAVDPQFLSQKGSLFFTRPTLVHYIASRAELQQRTGELFDWIGSGALRLRTEFEFPLKDAARAHESLAGRKTTGKVLLIPD
jgi:NADPH:quinone reductase